MKIKSYLTIIGTTLIMTSPLNAAHSFEPEYEGGYPTIETANENFEQAIADYIQKFPYQDSYNYAVRYTGRDPSKLNIWVVGAEPTLVKAGEDKIVRMNNDTYYKMAVVVLSQGPVVLAAEQPTDGRFVSFQLMDDRNVNFRNVIHPSGKYTLYYGEAPASHEGEAISVPSEMAWVIVRVEVKDLKDSADVAESKAIFNGITIAGSTPTAFPQLDLLSGFAPEVVEEANKRMQEVFETTAFSDLVAGLGDVPEKVSYLKLAAGTKNGWGGPMTSHSAYETFFYDQTGNEMLGSKGTYTITTAAPPVDAFWSVTVYDTSRGGFLHPNSDNRYHINNTSAVPNPDGTYTFIFKTNCSGNDVNCLAVPEGQFDIATRYYLPQAPIQSGEWKMPRPQLQK